ncbi:YesK family protein [Lentibacillus sp. N15]|uniref:YesK family protein n=1 Tax=Lentibacillus songyuanensis TaxID=3136161 RepID=UPI0031BAE2A8
MNSSNVQEWLPLILAGIIAAAVIVVLARFIHKAVLYAITTFASLLCIAAVFISVSLVGGWEGMGIGLFAVAVYLGLIVGTVGSMFVRKR